MVKRKTIDLDSYNADNLVLGSAHRVAGGAHRVRRIRYRGEARAVVPVEGRVLRVWRSGDVARVTLQPARAALLSFVLDAEARLADAAHGDGWLGAAPDDFFKTSVRCTSSHGNVLQLAFIDPAGEGPVSGLREGDCVRGELVMAGLHAWDGYGGAAALHWEVPASGCGLQVVEERCGPAFVLPADVPEGGGSEDGGSDDDDDDAPQPDAAEVEAIVASLRRELAEREAKAAAEVALLCAQRERLTAALEEVSAPHAGLAEACRASRLLAGAADADE